MPHADTLKSQLQYVFNQNNMLADYTTVGTSSYNTTTGAPAVTQTPFEVRLLIEGLVGDFSLNSIYPRTPPEVERFDIVASIHAADCLDLVSPFTPAKGDKVVIPATSILAVGQAQKTYRVVGAVARHVHNKVVTFLVYLLDA